MSKKNIVRWGIMGTGPVAGLFAEGLNSLPDAQLYGIASRSFINTERFAKIYGAAKAYGSYREIVADKDIDIIYIATPTALHKEHCLLCINAGKPVLCEKPFAVNAGEASDIIKVAQSRKVFCMEAMWMRFLPLMRDLRLFCNNDKLGDIRVIQAFLGHNHELDTSNSLFNRDLGGGALLDLGCYLLSFVFSLWGPPEHVTSRSIIGETGVDEDTSIILDYSKNRTALLGCSIRSIGPNNAYIIGTKGMVEIKNPIYRPHKAIIHSAPLMQPGARFEASSYISRLKNNSFFRDVATMLRDVLQLFGISGSVSVQKRLFEGNGYNYEAHEAMQCIRTGKMESDIMPLDESLGIIRVMDNILKSN